MPFSGVPRPSFVKNNPTLSEWWPGKKEKQERQERKVEKQQQTLEQIETSEQGKQAIYRNSNNSRVQFEQQILEESHDTAALNNLAEQYANDTTAHTNLADSQPNPLDSALARSNKLFSQKTPQEAAYARKKAQANVSHYFENNNCGYIPEKVKTLFALADETIEDVQTIGIPYGRGNVFVTNSDKAFNLDEMFARRYLSEIFKATSSLMKSETNEEEAIQHAAVSLFTGGANCGGYTSVFVSAMTDRVSKLEWADDESIKIAFVEAPVVEGLVDDHALCLVTYTCTGENQEKQEYIVVCDPWSQMNTPILIQHSRIEDCTRICSFEPKDAADLKEKIDNYIQKADELQRRVRLYDDLRRSMSDYQNLLKKADPEDSDSIESTEGYWLREQLNIAEPEIKLPRKRNPTHLSALNSDVVRAAKVDVKSCTAADIARLMLDGIDNEKTLREWVDGLALPQGKDTLHNALTYVTRGTTAFGRALEFGRCGVLDTMGHILARGDKGGLTDEQWEDVLFAEDSTGPALLRMLKRLSKNPILAADTIREYAKLLQLLPEPNRLALLNDLFGAEKFGEVLRNYAPLQSVNAMLDMLPAEGIDPSVRSELETERDKKKRAEFADRLRMMEDELAKNVFTLTRSQLTAIADALDDPELTLEQRQTMQTKLAEPVQQWVARMSDSPTNLERMPARIAVLPKAVRDMVETTMNDA